MEARFAALHAAGLWQTRRNSVLAMLDGYKCSFSQQSAAFPAVTADLKAMGNRAF